MTLEEFGLAGCEARGCARAIRALGGNVEDSDEDANVKTQSGNGYSLRLIVRCAHVNVDGAPPPEALCPGDRTGQHDTDCG